MRDTQVADDLIAALPLVRGILDGDSGPWEIPPGAFRGLSVMLIAIARANAELMGITSPEGQDAHVRGWLDQVHGETTLLAFRQEGAFADE